VGLILGGIDLFFLSVALEFISLPQVWNSVQRTAIRWPQFLWFCLQGTTPLPIVRQVKARVVCLTPLITTQFFFVNVKIAQVCDIPRLRQFKLDFYVGALLMACNNFIYSSSVFSCLEIVFSATRNYSVVP
jgi:hypothetical protein